MYKLTVNSLSDFTVKRVAVQSFRIQGTVILSILDSSLCSGFRVSEKPRLFKISMLKCGFILRVFVCVCV